MEQKCSNVIYLDIIDEYANNRDTILNTLALLQERLEIGKSVKYLGVVGDGKTYDHLHSLKGVWRRAELAHTLARRLAYT